MCNPLPLLVLLLLLCATSCSSPAATNHIATAADETVIYNGSIAAQQYGHLRSTMHEIIKQQSDLKQREKQKGCKGQTSARSHFQRTPAFVHSAVQAALEVMSKTAVSFPPPRGGFTDVGKHTGSEPRATTWAVLQAVLKVRLRARRTCCAAQ